MPNDVITRAIDALASGHDLPREQTGAVLGEIMRGDASETQIAAFLIALRTKGETVDELAGLAGTMRALATPVAGGRAARARPTPPARRPPPPPPTPAGGGKKKADVQRLDDRGADRRRRRLRA